MTLFEIRTAMVATLAGQFPTLKVEAHGGRFTEKELAMVLAKAPALLLGCMGFSNVQRAGPSRWRSDLRWVLYVLGSDTAVTPRDVLALDAVFALHMWLPDQKWGVSEARLPDLDTLTADNLYTGHANNLRVSLWGVAWTQSFIVTV